MGSQSPKFGSSSEPYCVIFFCYCYFIRLTLLSRPNKVGLKCPSVTLTLDHVRTYVRLFWVTGRVFGL